LDEGRGKSGWQIKQQEKEKQFELILFIMSHLLDGRFGREEIKTFIISNLRMFFLIFFFKEN
jgi:hypothetical protein